MRAFISECLRPTRPVTLEARGAEADGIFDMLGVDMDVATSQTARQQSAHEKQINAILRLVEEGQGANIPGVRGTVWGAYNAVTEYATHAYPVRGTDRTQSVMVGAAGALLDRAIAVAEQRVS
jgi:hypothetical protein